MKTELETKPTYPSTAMVQEAAQRLSDLLIPRDPNQPLDLTDCLAEIRLADGGSVVVGAWPMVGYINDEEKLVVSFHDAKFSDVAFFDQRLKGPMEAAGYRFMHFDTTPQYRNYQEVPRYDHGMIIDALRLIEDRKILPQIHAIFRGEASPLSMGGKLKKDFSDVEPTSTEARLATRVQLPLSAERTPV
jgi:hypothetical protein